MSVTNKLIKWGLIIIIIGFSELIRFDTKNRKDIIIKFRSEYIGNLTQKRNLFKSRKKSSILFKSEEGTPCETQADFEGIPMLLPNIIIIMEK